MPSTHTVENVQLPRPIRRLLLPDQVRTALDAHVEREHPVESGGYLACTRRGGTLVATEHYPVVNDADEPTRRFETTIDDRAPALPRVFYHSHTSAASPAGLTTVDRRQIPERYSLVLFAPEGAVYSHRGFKRGLARWHELSVCGGDPDDAGVRQPLPRLP
jgi:proteasome lid subunit RPN8/RPN11